MKTATMKAVREALKSYRSYCAMMGLPGSRSGRTDWIRARVPDTYEERVYHPIAGGYSFASLRVGLVVRNPIGDEIYCQPGDDEEAMRANIGALYDIAEDVDDAKRATLTDMTLGEYFS